MAAIFQIALSIQIADEADAGGDGPVYLGMCGREFSADLRGVSDDFERNTSELYIFGRNHNVENDSKNDPRAHRLFTENIDDFPVYIRLAHPTEHLKLARGFAFCNGDLLPMWDTARHFGSGIWLGRHTGMIVYLTKNSTEELSDDVQAAVHRALSAEA